MRDVSTRQAQTRFSTVKEVAQVLRVSHMTIRRLTADGTLPAFKVGTAVRIPTAAVWQYLERNRVPSQWTAERSAPAQALPLAPAS